MNKQVNLPVDFKPIFSGHETFSLRYGWLEKAYHAVSSSSENPFSRLEAIAELGVGKNMVSSIKYWALATGFLLQEGDVFRASKYAEDLMAPESDPYLEKADSLWRIHYELAKNPRNTGTYFLFNFLNENIFDKAMVLSRIHDFLTNYDLKFPAEKTLNSDVTVLLANYSSREKKSSREDDITCPLTELRLIRAQADGRFSFNLGVKTTLSQNLFITCLMDFWDDLARFSGGSVNTLKFEQILHAVGSPGRIFLLDERELVGRLEDIEKLTDGHIVWSETAGIQQLVKTSKYDPDVFESGWKL